MEELGIEQLHYSAFQGSVAPKSEQFKAFLNDIRMFGARANRSEVRIFCSYGHPRENKDGEEWHSEFIEGLSVHLEEAGLTVWVDNRDSSAGHELNAFMQRIEQSNRVFVFGSKTRDFKLKLPVSGVRYETSLILRCQEAKSTEEPFIIQVALSEEAQKVSDSHTLKNAPLGTDYILLLKWLIREVYGFSEGFEKYWQDRLVFHKIMDHLFFVPAQEPNIVRRAGCLKNIETKLNQNNKVVCFGENGVGKKQLCLNYIWENYFRFSEVYWVTNSLANKEKLKTGALVVCVDCDDPQKYPELLARQDIKVLFIARDPTLFVSFECIAVDCFENEEARLFVTHALEGCSREEWEALLGTVGLLPRNISFACGYIIRNRINVFEYCSHHQESSQFKLKPIREPASRNVQKILEKKHVPLVRQRRNSAEYVGSHSLEKPQIANPLDDDKHKEKLRFEEQQVFCDKAGHVNLLDDVGRKVKEVTADNCSKIVFISFAFPPLHLSDEKQTEFFVTAFVGHLKRVGMTVFYARDKDLKIFMEENPDLRSQVHIFVIGTRCRVNSADIEREDGTILDCLKTYSELQHPSRRFIVPIMLTSQKYFNPVYEQYAAHSFYELGYTKGLRDLVRIIFKLHDDFNKFWLTKSLKHSVECNWWPNRPTENPNFVGRRKLLEDMQKYLWNSRELFIVSAHGMGGIGKTHLVFQFAFEYGYKYSEIFLLSGENKNVLLQKYVQLGVDKHILDPLDKRSTSEERARKVIDWLQNKCPEGWLLIIDNAKNYLEIKDWLPAKGGKTVVTSRHTEWPGRYNIKVDKFSLEEANEYFVKIFGKVWVETQLESIDELVKLLGNLPLAIAQACAYIKQQSIIVFEYLKLYMEKRQELQHSNILSGGESHDAVAVTWGITLVQMSKEHSSSVVLLYALSQLHYENIPVYLFRKHFIDKPEYDNALRVMSEYSMVDYNEGNETVSMHVLVQEVTRQSLNEQERARSLDLAFSCVVSCHPGMDALLNSKNALDAFSFSENMTLENIVVARSLLSHLEVLSEKVKDYEDKRTDLLDLMQVSYAILGDPQKRIKITEEYIAIHEVKYGAESREIVAPLMGCANAYGDAGEWRTKLQLLGRALTILQNLPNLVELVILRCMIMCNMANVFVSLNNRETAKNLMETCLPVMEKILGSDHPEVGNLYLNLSNLSDEENGRNYAERGASIIEKKHGSDHPLYGKALLILITHLTDAARAQGLIKRVLRIFEEHYGLQHFEVAQALLVAAEIYGKLGKQVKAMSRYERAIKIFSECPNSEEVILDKAVVSLGKIKYAIMNDRVRKLQLEAIEHSERADFPKAIALLEECVNIYELGEKVDGIRHLPNFTRILHGLGMTYWKNKNYQKSLDCLKRAKLILEEIRDVQSVHNIQTSIDAIQSEYEHLQAAEHFSSSRAFLAPPSQDNSTSIMPPGESSNLINNYSTKPESGKSFGQKK